MRKLYIVHSLRYWCW